MPVFDLKTLTVVTSGIVDSSIIFGSDAGQLGSAPDPITALAFKNYIMPAIADDRVLANISGSAAAPSANTLSAIIDACIGGTQGNILYRDASSWVTLAPGTSGQFLKTQGAGANPLWDTVAGAGTPGGADTQVQYNDGSSFGGDAGFTYNETTNIATLVGGLALGAGASISWNSAAAEIVESSGAILFKDGGTENVRINDAGRVLANYSSALSTSGLLPRLQIASSSPGGDNSITYAVFGDDIGGAVQFALKTRGADPGAHTIVQDEDDLFELQCRGSDGTGYIRSIAILGTVDGAPGTNDMPGRWTFHTTPNGGSAAIERFRINSAGNINIGGCAEAVQNWPTLFGSQMRFNILGNTFETAAAVVARYSANASGPGIFMAKSRHATIGSHTAVVDNDVLWDLGGYGSDGTEFIFGASISARVNGTVSTGVVPADIEIVTGNTSGTLVTAKFDLPTTATHTGLLLYDVDNNTLERVTVGVADSGGSGFKVLRIPN